MIEALMQLHKFYKGFAGAEKCLEETIGRSICIAGCGKCCEHNTVQCMTIEAINAVSILTGQGKLTQAVSIAEGWLLDHHKQAPTYEGMVEGRLLPAGIHAEFIALAGLPCPFLAENKECLIHDARPISCRAYGITRTGKGFCPRPTGKGETVTNLMYIQAPGLRQDIEKFKTRYTRSHPEWTIFGLLPTLIFRAAKEKEFRKLVKDNRIASAKLVGSQVDMTLIWQPQLDAIRSGVSPDLVAQVNQGAVTV